MIRVLAIMFLICITKELKSQNRRDNLKNFYCVYDSLFGELYQKCMINKIMDNSCCEHYEQNICILFDKMSRKSHSGRVMGYIDMIKAYELSKIADLVETEYREVTKEFQIVWDKPRKVTYYKGNTMNGLPHGKWYYYNGDELIAIRRFRKGLMDGKQLDYFVGKKIVRNYRDGLKHGKQKIIENNKKEVIIYRNNFVVKKKKC